MQKKLRRVLSQESHKTRRERGKKYSSSREHTRRERMVELYKQKAKKDSEPLKSIQEAKVEKSLNESEIIKDIGPNGGSRTPQKSEDGRNSGAREVGEMLKLVEIREAEKESQKPDREGQREEPGETGGAEARESQACGPEQGYCDEEEMENERHSTGFDESSFDSRESDYEKREVDFTHLLDLFWKKNMQMRGLLEGARGEEAESPKKEEEEEPNRPDKRGEESREKGEEKEEAGEECEERKQEGGKETRQEEGGSEKVEEAEAEKEETQDKEKGEKKESERPEKRLEEEKKLKTAQNDKIEDSLKENVQLSDPEHEIIKKSEELDQKTQNKQSNTENSESDPVQKSDKTELQEKMSFPDTKELETRLFTNDPTSTVEDQPQKNVKVMFVDGSKDQQVVSEEFKRAVGKPSSNSRTRQS